MVQVVGVRFKPVGKVYYFDPGQHDIAVGDNVIVETARGLEYGNVAVGLREIAEDQVVQPLKKVMRIGTEKDAHIALENKRREKEAFITAKKKIEAHGLDMNLVDVEYTFDGSKNIFYFTAEGRIDFRELVRDLASVFRARIEMRQIGVRDEAKLLGGIGPCGRILCCTSFLGDFAPVSIRMAKDQNLALNPSKISGLCGRLMCCLRYEQETYEAAKKDPTLAPGYMPPILAEADSELSLDDLDDSPRPMRTMRTSDTSVVSDRVARAAESVERKRRQAPPPEHRQGQGERTQRPEQGYSQERPATKPGGGGRNQQQGAPRPPGANAPRRDHQPKEQQPRDQQAGAPGERPSLNERRGAPPRRGQQPSPARPVGGGERPMQVQGRAQQSGQPPRKGQQMGGHRQGERPQGAHPPREHPPGERPPMERPAGERSRHHRHRSHRPKSAEGPQGSPNSQA